MDAMDVFSSWKKPGILVALMGVRLINPICNACWNPAPLSYELHNHRTYKKKLRLIILFHFLLI